MVDLTVVKNLNSETREIMGKGLSRVWFLVGRLGGSRLGLARIGKGWKSISKIGGGIIGNSQKRQLGVRRTLGWRGRGRSVETVYPVYAA